MTSESAPAALLLQCGFCTDSPTVGYVPIRPFATLTLDAQAELVDRIEEAGPAWGICACCAPLVESRDLAGLAERATLRLFEMLKGVQSPEVIREFLNGRYLAALAAEPVFLHHALITGGHQLLISIAIDEREGAGSW